MTTTHTLGSNKHQTLLDAITTFYDDDVRVTAVLLFGSVSRGDWDQYSDLDLDIVMTQETQIDARAELQALCADLERKLGVGALIIAKQYEGDVVLTNLMEFSIRYHPLDDTKPAILADMRKLSGSLTLDEVRAAANPAHAEAPKEMADLVNRYIRYLLGMRNALKRGRMWMAIDLLHRLRGLLISMYALTNGGQRPTQFFDAQATPWAKDLLAVLCPHPTLEALEMACFAARQLIGQKHDQFYGADFQLSDSQRAILDQL